MNTRKVLLVGWDAADWKVIKPLIAAGQMPHLQRLIEAGAAGSIATLHPPLSPMLWTSVATGKRPFKHGVHGFSEPAADGRGVRPVTNLSRKCKAVWNILNQSGFRSAVVGWWPSHPAEPINGVMVSDQYHRATGPLEEGWPLSADAVHPVELSPALAGLRVHPDMLDANTVERFIPLARSIDQDRDKRLGALMRMLAECLTIQSAALWVVENRPWDFFAVYFDSIDHFSHGFMRYHPPRQPRISERDFELYRNVVSSAYQLHDEMLGALLAKAGDHATVLLMSDHGFHPDHMRPDSIPDVPAGPAVEHRDFGILVLKGPRIRRNALLDGASLLDIAPTVLNIFDLPVGLDMDGKVLSQAFTKAPDVRFIPSWEQVAGPDGCHPSQARLDPVAAHEAMEQMIALGYVKRPPQDSEAAVQATVRELRYNLAASYQDAGRHVEARRILAELCADHPDEQRFAVALFASCQALGFIDEMRRIVTALDGRRRALFEDETESIAALPSSPTERLPNNLEVDAQERRNVAGWRNLARDNPLVTEYLRALLFIAEKRDAEALAALERIAEARLNRPDILLQVAHLNLRLRRWDKAQEIYRTILSIDAENAYACLGLSRLALRRRDFGHAANAALEALQRAPDEPLAHYFLGRALAGMHQYDRASDAFRAAIAINPNFPQAHLRLAVLLKTRLRDARSARNHRRLAHIMRLKQPAATPVLHSQITGIDDPLLPIASTRATEAAMPPISECAIVVTGLPRSGTSMLMQMLAAGGLRVLSDESRGPDEDNPRGYFEFAPVMNLLADSSWLLQHCGVAIKIVTPLLPALPSALACRVILCERDLDEVLDSQQRMLLRRGHSQHITPERRRVLRNEYARALARAKTFLAHRPRTQVLALRHRDVISDPAHSASRINEFLCRGLDVARMVAAVDPTLYRNRFGVAIESGSPTLAASAPVLHCP